MGGVVGEQHLGDVLQRDGDAFGELDRASAQSNEPCRVLDLASSMNAGVCADILFVCPAVPLPG